jgi:hypothetical protein
MVGGCRLKSKQRPAPTSRGRRNDQRDALGFKYSCNPNFLRDQLGEALWRWSSCSTQGLVYKGMLFLSQGIMISLATPEAKPLWIYGSGYPRTTGNTPGESGKLF